jgi:hypothetical protein
MILKAANKGVLILEDSESLMNSQIQGFFSELQQNGTAVRAYFLLAFPYFGVYLVHFEQ